MPDFATLQLPSGPTDQAPDGSEARALLRLAAGGMAHFTLPSGGVSGAVTHRTVEEIWYIVAGRGEMWRKSAGREEVTELRVGTCLTIPLGTHFQFRAHPGEALSAVAVTMPPWPGADEAAAVQGPWTPTISPPA